MAEMPSVLIVDGAVDVQKRFAQILAEEKYEVVSALNGKEAIRAAQRRHVDIALVELHLADMSGLDFIRECRRGGLDSIALVIMTATGTVASAVQALKLGATDYVEKPLNRSQLLALVRVAGTHRLEMDTIQDGAHAPRPATWPPENNAADVRVLRALAIIEQRYADERLTVRTAAKELGIAPEYLCRLFKLHTGLTFGLALDDHRIQLAQRLLHDTALTCKEIAARVGYGSTGRLDRRFQRRLRITPTALRHSK